MCVKSKTVTFIDEESRMMVGVQERRKRGDAGQRVQGFSYAKGSSKTLMDSKVSMVTSTTPYA